MLRWAGLGRSSESRSTGKLLAVAEPAGGGAPVDEEDAIEGPRNDHLAVAEVTLSVLEADPPHG